MKKIQSFLTKNKQLVLGVFGAGILTASAVGVVYSQLMPNTNTQELVTNENSYGALGYGRGNGNGNGQGALNQGYEKSQKENQNNRGLNKNNCLMDGCLLVDDSEYPVSELSQETIGFLEAAIADERKALATYEAVINKFGAVRPFINIARAEEQHITMLKALFDKYGVEIPADTTVIGSLPDSLSEVCAIGVQAEIDNGQLYQDMIGSIQEQDIKEVFTSLASASLNMHLPAFERCAN